MLHRTRPRLDMILCVIKDVLRNVEQTVLDFSVLCKVDSAAFPEPLVGAV